MKGRAASCRPHAGGGDHKSALNHNALHLPVPSSRILAVCPDKLLHRKLFVGIVPIYPSILTKIWPHSPGVLLQHRLPEFSHIHSNSSRSLFQLLPV